MVEVIFLGGQDHDGCVGHITNLAAHVQAALAGQHEVEHDDFRLEVEECRQGLIAAVHHAHLETVL